MHKQTLASNIKEEMMLEVVEIIDVALLLLHHIQVLTLQAPAVRPASLPRTVALAVLLEAVALQALAFDLYGHRLAQEQFLLVAAVPALAVRRATLAQLEALAVVLLASRLGAGAFADGRLGIGAGGGGSVGGFELARLGFFDIFGRDGQRCGLVIIVEGAFLGGLGFRAEQVQQVGIVFGFVESVHHDHDLLLFLHLHLGLLALHIDCNQLFIINPNPTLTHPLSAQPPSLALPASWLLAFCFGVAVGAGLVLKLQRQKVVRLFHEQGCAQWSDGSGCVSLQTPHSPKITIYLQPSIFSPLLSQKTIQKQPKILVSQQTTAGTRLLSRAALQAILIQSQKDIITVSQNIMKVNTCRLPPLPRKNADSKYPPILCQSIAIKQKCPTFEGERNLNDEDYQFLQPKNSDKPQEAKRPHTNASQNSLDPSRKEPDVKETRRSHSYETKKLAALSEFPPKVTAKSWIVYDMQQSKPIWTHRSHKKREMASLTKMMNLITILETVSSLGIDAKEVKVRASRTACEMTGTTAELRIGAEYTLYDLYFGMMLPSGNDAAHLIAQIGGFLLKSYKDSCLPSLREVNSRVNNEIETYSEQLVGLYLKEMNKVARKIDMNNSNFANPHGLSNTNNYSTAEDLAKLCTFSMKNPIFRRVVQTKRYNYSLPIMDKEDVETVASSQSIEDKENIGYNNNNCSKYASFYWQNTNRMLGQGWSGIKTGITPNAGPCLAASLARTLQGKRYEFLVVLLSSESMQARWNEVRDLVDWAIKNRRYI